MVQRLGRLLRLRKAGGPTGIKRVDRGAYVATIGNDSFLYAVFRVRRVANPTEFHSVTDLVRRVRRFVRAVCIDGCRAYIVTSVAQAPDSYIKEIERMITNKVVEYEYDRANARIRRELKILRTIHDKLVSGYLPLELSTLIIVSCPMPQAVDPRQVSRSVKERVDIASKVLGMEVEPIDVDSVLQMINFRGALL